MRLSRYPIIGLISLLLVAFSGFSLGSVLFVGIGATSMLIANWKRWKSLALAGYLLLASSTLWTISSRGMTDYWEILAIGLFLILPLSTALVLALTTGLQQDIPRKMHFAPYARAAMLASGALISVPLIGIFVHSSKLSTDVGVENEVILLGFATALMSIIFLGLDSDKD